MDSKPSGKSKTTPEQSACSKSTGQRYGGGVTCEPFPQKVTGNATLSVVASPVRTLVTKESE